MQTAVLSGVQAPFPFHPGLPAWGSVVQGPGAPPPSFHYFCDQAGTDGRVAAGSDSSPGSDPLASQRRELPCTAGEAVVPLGVQCSLLEA